MADPELSFWCCPLHHGQLTLRDTTLVAACCGRSFPVVAGIPDLRVEHPAWVDPEADRRQAERLQAEVPAEDVMGSIRWVFRQGLKGNERMVEQRMARMNLVGEKLRDEGTGWLAPAFNASGPLLDLGCGGGMLLAVLPRSRLGVGIDVSLQWLVVARRMTSAAGGRSLLAAGHAEALPLREGAVGSVVALDVIEHVGDPAAMLREVDRVLLPGGVFATATPNRFSLSAEPHVHLWGVGWLPRKWQKAYVTWRSGLPYDYCNLQTARSLLRLVRRNTSLRAEVTPASVPEAEVRLFSRRRRTLAAIYNRLLRVAPFRWLARVVGPFFHLVAMKPVPPGGGETSRPPRR